MRAKQITDLGTAALLNVGTASGDVLQLDSYGKLPQLDASNLLGLGGETTAALRPLTEYDGTTDITLSPTQNGEVFYWTNLSLNKAVYLPLAANYSAGFYFTLVQGGGTARLYPYKSSGSSDVIAGYYMTSLYLTRDRSFTFVTDGSSYWQTFGHGEF